MANDTERDPLDELAESFLERYRRGERPSLSEYAQQHPEYAERIEKLFPALVMMEELGPGDEEDVASAGAVAAIAGMDRLDDYQILREVGRGGMGVVYEAQQESLGRHVALKVLPFHALMDSNHLKRFQREARAAARLHHTNIVPVFEVGEHKGVHYYAMQFIHGQGLDEVVSELIEMRGKLHLPERSVAAKAKPSSRESAADASIKMDSSSSAKLPGLSALSGGSTTDQHYFRSVARIGSQAADALYCAHDQGILHRDVKPSNLMLDTEGKVWVTDFGLAKTDAKEDLTHTGDLVGTLRYMAPERFEGWSDPRSDIYGLGLTLYELLTLRPAYEESDRVRLIKRITHDDLPRPRRVDRNIPADLETIVLKAIAREPGERYQSAGDMAADLRRFSNNEPIEARRTSLADRVRLWRRRNPLVASLIAVVAVLLVAATVGASVAAVWLRSERDTALAHLNRAESAEETAIRSASAARDAESGERAARVWAQQNLYAARLGQARAGRWSGQAGRRFESLEALAQAGTLAKTLGLDDAARRQAQLELRNEAIACMALVDLRIDAQWPGHGPPSAHIRIAFDRDLTRYARLEADGDIIIRRLADNHELARFSALGDLEVGRPYLRFSPDDQLLAVKGSDSQSQQSLHVVVYDLESRDELLRVACGGAWEHPSLDFAPDSRRLAVAAEGGSVAVYELREQENSAVDAEGKKAPPQPRLVAEGAAPYCIRFAPDGKRIAVSRQVEVQLFDLESGRMLHRFRHPENTRGLAWSPDGNILAVACSDNRIHLWDASTGQRRVVCRGHFTDVEHVAFSPSGDLLASTSWDRTSRLWDVRTGEELVRTINHAIQFSSDGRWLGLGLAGTLVGRWEVALSGEYKTIRKRAAGVGRIDIHPDGRLGAMATDHGVELWDLATDARIGAFDAGRVTAIRFTPAGDYLVHIGEKGVYRWPIMLRRGLALLNESDVGIETGSASKAETSGSVDASPGRENQVAVGPPELVYYESDWSDGDYAISLSSDGGRLVAKTPNGGAVLVDLNNLDSHRLADADVWDVALSPDGKCVAAGTNALANRGVKIWDVDSRKLVRDLATTRATRVRFSPDGRWLVSSDWREFILWNTGDWQPEVRIAKDMPSNGATVAFTSDSRVMAITPSPIVVRLVELPSGRELATLEVPDPYPFGWLRFSPDGGRLFAVRTYGLTQVWDLRLVRSQLTEMGLDWAEKDSANVLVATDRRPSSLAPLRISVNGALLEPADAILLVRKGRQHHDRGNFNQAIAHFEKAIELDDKLAPAWYRRGRSSASLGHYEQAAISFERAAQLDQKGYFARLLLAWMYVHGGENLRDLKRAEEAALAAGNLNRGGYQWQEVLGLIHYRRGEFAEAVEGLTAIPNGSQKGVVQHVLALCRQKLGQTQIARRHLKQAVEVWDLIDHLDPFWDSVRRSLQAEAEKLINRPDEQIDD